ncbi:unnamed protein product [Arctia plantaginis]|uniref:BESS domain-containing protein n=1 Tax=Arctia plantaginis TaxID=874455 RepID=A0A8S0YYX4_ARCPL|nr:unnamed protein product [Arctia plantaginis]
MTFLMKRIVQIQVHTCSDYLPPSASSGQSLKPSGGLTPKKIFKSPKKKIKRRQPDEIDIRLLQIEEEKLKCFQESANDPDAQLMSLLPFLKDIPKHRKLMVRAKLQQVLIDEQNAISSAVLFDSSSDSTQYSVDFMCVLDSYDHDRTYTVRYEFVSKVRAALGSCFDHNSLIHYDETFPPVSLLSGEQANSNILLPTAQVKLLTKDKKVILAKAILDSGSQASLATDSLIKRLGLAPTPNSTNIISVGNSQNCAKYCIPLQIQSTISSYKRTINFHVVQQITCKLPQNEIDISKIKIFEGIVLADKDYHVPSNIDLLIGADVFFQILLPSQPEVELQSNNLVNTKTGICHRRHNLATTGT